MKPHTRGSVPTSGLQALYPFLYAPNGNRELLCEELLRSTREKIQEIAALRDYVVREQAVRLSTCAEAMANAFLAKGKLLTFGNGGSATDAQALAHLFLDPPTGRPLPAHALTSDIAVITALANDVGFDVVFSRQIAAFAQTGDIAIGFSTSGNSDNVISALAVAAQRELLTIGFSGYDGGKMAELESLAFLFIVPSSSVHRIQEAQTTLYNLLWQLTQTALIRQTEGG